MNRTRFICRSLFACLAVLLVAGPAYARIEGTAHDLRSGSGGDVCRFCHAPHLTSGQRALWSRGANNRVYTPYTSATMRALPGQPDGSSRLCLSCHDGTIAPGQPGPGSAWNNFSLSERANLSTDLSDDHPVSIHLRAGGGVVRPPAQAPVRLDAQGKVQCTSCHDAHDDRYDGFLVDSNESSRLCLYCHDPDGWDLNIHSVSNATFARENPWTTPYRTVMENACENCHRPHQAGRRQTLLNRVTVNDTCLACHDGNFGLAGNIAPAFTRISSHAAIHCDDCHASHSMMRTSGHVPPDVPAALGWIDGETVDGIPREKADFGYEVCFKCHGENQPRRPLIRRQVMTGAVSRSFATVNPSFHPVVSPGRSQNAPSLYNGWTVTSYVQCTDCHGDDEGTGTRGAHGSNFRPLLARNYETADFTMESAAAYALCYACHDRNSILDDRSFRGHVLHIVDQNAPCSACHDPHGVAQQAGATQLNNPHLINFDTGIVLPEDSTGRLEFQDDGEQMGRCTLKCHGDNHLEEKYDAFTIKLRWRR
ncbi:MAG: hypothetical protein JXQ27_16235 [Acidobacteria bacterium]|nr:hypothetical protein [Acidobacteriota bacterium]